jgi:hypothetical protein
MIWSPMLLSAAARVAELPAAGILADLYGRSTCPLACGVTIED